MLFTPREDCACFVVCACTAAASCRVIICMLPRADFDTLCCCPQCCDIGGGLDQLCSDCVLHRCEMTHPPYAPTPSHLTVAAPFRGPYLLPSDAACRTSRVTCPGSYSLSRSPRGLVRRSALPTARCCHACHTLQRSLNMHTPCATHRPDRAQALEVDGA